MYLVTINQFKHLCKSSTKSCLQILMQTVNVNSIVRVVGVVMIKCCISLSCSNQKYKGKCHVALGLMNVCWVSVVVVNKESHKFLSQVFYLLQHDNADSTFLVQLAWLLLWLFALTITAKIQFKFCGVSLAVDSGGNQSKVGCLGVIVERKTFKCLRPNLICHVASFVHTPRSSVHVYIYMYVDLGKQTFDLQVTAIGAPVSVEEKVAITIQKVAANVEYRTHSALCGLGQQFQIPAMQQLSTCYLSMSDSLRKKSERNQGF